MIVQGASILDTLLAYCLFPYAIWKMLKRDFGRVFKAIRERCLQTQFSISCKTLKLCIINKDRSWTMIQNFFYSSLEFNEHQDGQKELQIKGKPNLE